MFSTCLLTLLGTLGGGAGCFLSAGQAFSRLPAGIYQWSAGAGCRIGAGNLNSYSDSQKRGQLESSGACEVGGFKCTAIYAVLGKLENL